MVIIPLYPPKRYMQVFPVSAFSLSNNGLTRGGENCESKTVCPISKIRNVNILCFLLRGKRGLAFFCESPCRDNFLKSSNVRPVCLTIARRVPFRFVCDPAEGMRTALELYSCLFTLLSHNQSWPEQKLLNLQKGREAYSSGYIHYFFLCRRRNRFIMRLQTFKDICIYYNFYSERLHFLLAQEIASSISLYCNPKDFILSRI